MISARRWIRAKRDEGSALILVLVLMVIVAMMVLPLLDFAMAVGKSNEVLSQKTRRQEAVKAGLRMSLADPAGLYRHCAADDGGADQSIGMTPVNGVSLSTSCEFLSWSFAADDSELHLGLAATKMGAAVPPELRAVSEDPGSGTEQRLVFEMQSDRPLDQWYQDPPGAPYTLRVGGFDTGEPYTARPLSTPKHIWAPNLPHRLENPRGSTPYAMPAGYPACQVFFPGTYPDPVTLTGPTYFTSGIYYFEDVVTVTGTANVVVGSGTEEGCTTDQEAAFYAVDVPTPHNISGLGGTFVLGKNSRIVVTNDTGAPKLRFNQRYVNSTDFDSAASFGVSIMSVNGAVDGVVAGDGSYVLKDLDVPGVVHSRATQVGGIGLPMHYDLLEDANPANDPVIPPAEPANEVGYIPSSLTHAPRIPTAPLNVQFSAFRSTTPATTGVYVRWDSPARPGGLPIDPYVATLKRSNNTVAGTCSPSTPDGHECIVSFPNETNQTYSLSVTAHNTLGTSPASTAVSVTTSTSTTAKAAPVAPVPPTAASVFNGTAKLTWPAVTSTGSTRVVKYVVTAYVRPLPTIPPTVPEPAPTVTDKTCTVTLPLLLPDPPDPDHPDVIPVAPQPPNPLYCHVRGLDPTREYTFLTTAENLDGSVSLNSGLSSPRIAPATTLPTCDVNVEPAASATGCKDWVPPTPIVRPYEPDPIIDLVLSAPDRATDKVIIDIPGYISVPQGVFRLYNPNGLGSNPDGSSDGNQVEVSGGIIAASFRVRDGRADDGDLTVPIGLLNPPVQRTYMVTTRTTDSGPEIISKAVVQVNQNGAYAVNSWEIQ